jgi:hypothetical protein
MSQNFLCYSYIFDFTKNDGPPNILEDYWSLLLSIIIKRSSPLPELIGLHVAYISITTYLSKLGNEFKPMRVPTAPEQKIIRQLAYSRSIHELTISEHVIWKRNIQNETSCVTVTSHATHHMAPLLEFPRTSCNQCGADVTLLSLSGHLNLQLERVTFRLKRHVLSSGVNTSVAANSLQMTRVWCYITTSYIQRGIQFNVFL